MSVEKITKFLVTFLENSCKTDLKSQIEFIEFMNNNFVKTPILISTINSLKELQFIKLKNNSYQ